MAPGRLNYRQDLFHVENPLRLPMAFCCSSRKSLTLEKNLNIVIKSP